MIFQLHAQTLHKHVLGTNRVVNSALSVGDPHVLRLTSLQIPSFIHDNPISPKTWVVLEICLVHTKCVSCDDMLLRRGCLDSS